MTPEDVKEYQVSRPLSKLTLPGGATRSEKAPAYHLVPMAGHQRTSRRFELGAKLHGANNWKNSLDTPSNARPFLDEAFNHMMEHIHKMTAGIEPSDDHLGAIGWAHTVLCYAEEKFGIPWQEIGR